MRWWANSSLSTKIFLASAALVIPALVATLLLTQWIVGRDARRGLNEELLTTGEVFDGLIAERAARLEANSILLASDFALKRVIAMHLDPAEFDAETLASAAQSYQQRLDVELLGITDETGVLLTGLPEALRRGRSYAEVSPLEETLATGDSATAIAELDGLLYQLVAVPVLAPGVIGYLLLGQAVDDLLAKRLQDSTRSHITFLTPTRVLASSWPPELRTAVIPSGAERRELIQGSTEQATVLTLSGERFLTLARPLEARSGEPLIALIQGSFDAALEPLRSLQRRIAAVGVVALLVALAVGVGLARGITAPVQTLVGGMREVLSGNLKHRTEVARRDEIGFLARSFNEMVAGLEERERVKDTFGRFVSRDVADAILGGRVPLAGEHREVTILFQDVRGFTALSARLDPERLLEVLNRLFTEVVAAVEATGGVVKQFTGDGVMALFGAPQPYPDHAERAVRAALGIVARLEGLNAEWQRQGLAPLAIGIGIHCGEVVAGLIGPDRRVEYGVVGEAVNLASRIESLTKELNATVLISADIAHRLGGEFVLGRRATLPVKGRAEPMEVIEVLG
jgi:class 3 adenylate cyclase